VLALFKLAATFCQARCVNSGVGIGGCAVMGVVLPSS